MYNYFVIYNSEDGIKIKQKNRNNIEEFLEIFNDHQIYFLDRFPDDLDEFGICDIIVIKGEIIKPKARTIIQTFEVE